MSQKTAIINQLDEQEARWFAVYSFFKKEKYAEKELKRRGIETYLPLQKVIRKYKSKTKKLEIPLINCYLFVRIRKEEYAQVLETDGVIRFIKIGKDLLHIPDNEIDILQRILGEKIEVEAEATTFRAGDDVLISQGSLMGLKGKLVSFQGKEKVLIDLSSIGYTLQIELDKSLLQKV
jgi:transcription antitermination factor NusG